MHRGPGGPVMSALGLLLANAVPLVGVVAFDWDLHSVLVVYWLESAVVGITLVAKIRRAEGEDDPEELPSFRLNETPVTAFIGRQKRYLISFFVFHYGMFWVVHGVFVLVLPSWFAGLDRATPDIVILGTVSLAAYHVLSYWANFIGRREYTRRGPVALMVEPYQRVFVLHLTILIGAFVVAMIGAPVGALVVMVGAKTALDFRGHWREHASASPQRSKFAI